jgi:hypothetical protein
MSAPIRELAPAGAVAALVMFCCWPYLDGPGPGATFQQSGDYPAIPSSLLSPAFDPPSGRDPFRPSPGKEAKASQREVLPVPAFAQKEPVAGEDRGEDMGDVLNGLVLNATYVRGNRQLALINGQECSPGDPIPLAATAEKPGIVTQISAYRVLIEHQGRTLELRYRDPP